MNGGYFPTFLLPKTHDKAIEYIETITDVPNKTIGCQLQKHFNSEDATEDKIAHFNNLGNLYNVSLHNQYRYESPVSRSLAGHGIQCPY